MLPEVSLLRSGLMAVLGAGVLLYGSSTVQAADLPELTIYTENDPPYVTVDEQGQVGGLTKPRLQRFLQSIGYSARDIKVQPWVRAYKEAMSQPNVLIYPIAKTPEREARLTYLYRLYDASVYFYRLSERTDIRVNNLASAKKYRVCAVRGDYRAEYLQSQRFGRIDLAPDSTANLKKFLAGRCDLAILTEIGIHSKLAQLNEKPERVSIAYPLLELDSNLYIAINSSSKPETIKLLKKRAAALD
ncbi:transporter substrate-binding domain-containing protein [Chitinibacter sp. FCG-7]|uniref:Transporter substrate-binding domain-containing protein n=1 Tax=Chitinibacter mangrovi TaxID=3153927 RepID=A0AAU7FES9_9NEIS